jgi:H+/Cl- antiporter ClcA
MKNQLSGILSVRDWKTRLIFWSGALAVGLIAALFAVASNQVMALHASIIAKSRWWAFLLSPLAMIAVVSCSRLLFPGTRRSRRCAATTTASGGACSRCASRRGNCCSR